MPDQKRARLISVREDHSAGGAQPRLQGLRSRFRALVMAPHLPACLRKLGAEQRAQAMGATGDEYAFKHQIVLEQGGDAGAR